MRNSEEPTGVRMRPYDLFLETGGARLRYRDEGAGCAVILVHGWTLDLDQWESQAAALAGEFRVVRWDRRGFGLSSGRPSITADGDDLLALYRHLELDCAALVGMSQGARVVIRFAESHPEMISCFVLDGPPRFAALNATDNSPDVPFERYCELVRGQGLAAFRREWSEHPLVSLRSTDPEARARLAHMIGRYPGNDLADEATRARPVGETPAFDSVDQPAMLINGEFDLDSRKRAAAELAAQLNFVERVEIPDAGHLCNLDNPRAYNENLKRFLRRHASPSTDHSRTVQ